MSVDMLGTSCDQCVSMVQYSFTSTETRRLIRMDSPGRPPQLSHSSWTKLNKSCSFDPFMCLDLLKQRRKKEEVSDFEKKKKKREKKEDVCDFGEKRKIQQLCLTSNWVSVKHRAPSPAPPGRAALHYAECPSRLAAGQDSSPGSRDLHIHTP